jgi:RimJ/RimL family protein N-acetyltransferase
MAKVLAFVLERIPVLSAGDMEPYAALGLAEIDEEGFATFLAGVIYHNWRQPNIEITFAATRNWATRGFIRSVFNAPFNQMGCTRITCLTPKRNKKSRNLLTKLGFVPEGNLRRALSGRDLLIYGMLKEECKWIK